MIGRAHARHRAPRGMTLIEIMVVVGVFALMASMVVVGFGTKRSAELNEAVTDLANTMRFAFDKSRVTGRYYRLLIDLDENRFSLQVADEAMFLSPTDRDGKTLVLSEAEREERARRDEQAKEAYFRQIEALGGGGGTGGYDPYAVRAKDVPRRRPPLFESFSPKNELSSLGKPIVLPEGARVVYVRTAEDPQPITSGQAAIYFFPPGRTQLAHVQIVDERAEDEAYTIVLQPLTGRVKILPERVDLELPQDPHDRKDDLGRKQDRRSF
ncbi:MAG: type II secretion system protein [Deltaproteobacteria bacterium]|nr:MAG: type II secretion system protein [Deltaproteobacteria bacterium]